MLDNPKLDDNRNSASNFASRYLQNNVKSPARDPMSELKQTISTLKKELKSKSDLISEQEKHKTTLQKEYERKIDQTRRDTRERVQKVMEKRLSTGRRPSAADGLIGPLLTDQLRNKS